MDKITDFKGITQYYCSECKHNHIRKYKYVINNDNVRIKTENTPFFRHKEFAFKLTHSEKFREQFNKSCERYSIESHKKSSGSSKQ